MDIRPGGTVTFPLTDIEGSTQRWESDPQTMSAALSQHDALLTKAIQANSGYVFKTVGDAFCVAFATPHAALAAAVEAQQALYAQQAAQDGDNLDNRRPLHVRMALHTGVTEERDGDYFGQPVNRV